MTQYYAMKRMQKNWSELDPLLRHLKAKRQSRVLALRVAEAEGSWRGASFRREDWRDLEEYIEESDDSST